MANKERAARLAYLCLVRLSIKMLPVWPQDFLYRCENTRLTSYAEFADRAGVLELALREQYGFEAESHTIVRQTPNGVSRIILYDSHIDISRRRFSLAHELGHIVLKHPENLSRTHEIEADFFASHLLYPRPVIETMVKRGFKPTVSKLAELTRCSRQSAETYMRLEKVYIEPVLYEKVADLFSYWIDDQLGVPHEPPKHTILRVPERYLRKYLATGDLSVIADL